MLWVVELWLASSKECASLKWQENAEAVIRAETWSSSLVSSYFFSETLSFDHQIHKCQLEQK